MKILKYGLPIFTMLMALTTLQAQTVDDIINKHIITMGGEEKLSQLKSIHMEMYSVDGTGNKRPISVTTLEGKAHRSETEMNGQKLIQVLAYGGGWMKMGSSAPKPLPAEQLKQAESEFYITDQLYNYAGKGNTVELLGQEKIVDVNVFKLKVTTKGGLENNYYIDASTYYIIQVERKMERGGQQVTITVTNSDFQKTPEGYVLARTIKTAMGSLAVTTIITEVDINPIVDAGIFEMPE